MYDVHSFPRPDSAHLADVFSRLLGLVNAEAVVALVVAVKGGPAIC
jgi:hypothetical protein